MKAFYSVKSGGAFVYHNNPDCEAGQRIQVIYMREGTGDRPLCRRCDYLNKAHSTEQDDQAREKPGQ